MTTADVTQSEVYYRLPVRHDERSDDSHNITVCISAYVKRSRINWQFYCSTKPVRITPIVISHHTMQWDRTYSAPTIYMLQSSFLLTLYVTLLLHLFKSFILTWRACLLARAPAGRCKGVHVHPLDFAFKFFSRILFMHRVWHSQVQQIEMWQQVLCSTEASIWFEIWGVVDPGQKISIYSGNFTNKKIDFSEQISENFDFFR